MIESETTAAITNEQLKRAMRWIRSWKRQGGMFGFNELQGRLAIEYIRTWDENGKRITWGHRQAEKLLRGLFNRPELQRVVETLIMDAWARRQAQGTPPTLN